MNIHMCIYCSVHLYMHVHAQKHNTGADPGFWRGGSQVMYIYITIYGPYIFSPEACLYTSQQKRGYIISLMCKLLRHNKIIYTKNNIILYEYYQGLQVCKLIMNTSIYVWLVLSHHKDLQVTCVLNAENSVSPI